MAQHKAALVATAAVLALLTAVQAQSGCELEPCQYACYDRPGSLVSDYVCDCSQTSGMGFACDIPTDSIMEDSCYGDDCFRGTFFSPSMPGPTESPSSVPSPLSWLYLVFVPGAQRIVFTFNITFSFSDRLYFSSGLEYNTSDPDFPAPVSRDSDLPSESGQSTHFSDAALVLYENDLPFELATYQIDWEAFIVDYCAQITCRNGGTCQNIIDGFVCACIDGFTGDICDININECYSSPCLNGGVCIDGMNSFTCECAPGHTDTTCEIDINECDCSPCLNGGVCVDRVNSFTCQCAPGFVGTFCETDIVCFNSNFTTQFGEATLPTSLPFSNVSSPQLCPHQSEADMPIIDGVCRLNATNATYWDVSVRCEREISVTDILVDILEANITKENETIIITKLVDVTSNADDVTDVDVCFIADILDLIGQLNTTDANMAISYIELVGNLMDVDVEVLAIAQEYGNCTTQIIESLETRLDRVILDGENGSVIGYYPNIAVLVRDISVTEILDGIVVTMASPDIGNLSSGNITLGTYGYTPLTIQPDTVGRCVIPREVALVSAEGATQDPPGNVSGALRIVFVGYVNDDMFPSSSLRQLNQGAEDFNRSVNTPVISITIGGRKMEDLTERVNITFLRLTTDETDPVCNFWEFDVSKWSSRGCDLLPSDASTVSANGMEVSSLDLYYTCACDHFTNFAVLVDIYAPQEPPKPVLRLLSIIGCSVSCLCLVITLLTYLSIAKVRNSQSQQIFICLCFSLLGLYACALAIVILDTTYLVSELEAIPCNILAGFGHFFLLSSFTWMGIEGFNTYLVIIKVFDTYIPRFMFKAAIVGWGLPALIVGASGGIARRSYANGDFCYLQKWPLIVGILIPMALILVINVIVFTLAICRLDRSAKMASRVRKDVKSERAETAARVENGVAMLILLGLTWAAGYLTLIQVEVADLIFIIANSLQGFFIFLLYGVRKATIRQQWRRVLCCACGIRDGKTTDGSRAQGTNDRSSSGQTGTSASGPSSPTSASFPNIPSDMS